MGNMKQIYYSRELEQQSKRQQQEARRLAEKEKRIAIAKSIVESQPVIGGMKIMDRNSEEILKILLKMYDECKSYDISESDKNIPEGYQDGLIQIFDALQQYGMIFSHREFSDGTFHLSISPQALTYFEDKEKAQEAELEKQKQQNINIQNLTATGSSINFGTISNSTVTAQNIVSEIERRIEEQGGEDKAELESLLADVKELCEDIKSNMPLPKRANLMNKISSHLEKHSWFYGAVAQLIGNAAMVAMTGK